MSEQPTENGRYATIAQQAPALDAFASLMRTFPSLPAVSLTIHSYGPAEMWAQPDTAADVEAWRVALQVPPSEVRLYVYASYCSLEFDGFALGVKVKVFTSTSLAPNLAEVSPQEDAERQAAALVEQPQPVEDAAAPPQAFEPVPPIDVRPLAEMPGGAA
jgi:hypothetical protein